MHLCRLPFARSSPWGLVCQLPGALPPQPSRAPQSHDVHLLQSSVSLLWHCRSKVLTADDKPYMIPAIPLTSPTHPSSPTPQGPFPGLHSQAQTAPASGLEPSAIASRLFTKSQQVSLHVSQVSIQMLLYSQTTLCKVAGTSHFSIQVCFLKKFIHCMFIIYS